MSGRREAYPRRACSVGNRSVGPALISTRAIFSRLVFQVGLWDQVGSGADWAYLYFCFVQRRDRMEDKLFRLTELCSFWICSLDWMFWLRFSAWASENAEHVSCSAFVVLKQPGGRRCNLETTVI